RIRFPAQTVGWVRMEFRVFWEIDVHADSLLKAAEQARALQLDAQMPATVFTVWDYAKLKMHRIDVAPPADQLDTAALTSVRSALRRLQCATNLEAGLKDLVAVMLIFLDAENGKVRRHDGRRTRL
ncbi:MAG: hypothetical protein WA510_12145, partial [Acidobacteriaceae bacterium]